MALSLAATAAVCFVSEPLLELTQWCRRMTVQKIADAQQQRIKEADRFPHLVVESHQPLCA